MNTRTSLLACMVAVLALAGLPAPVLADPPAATSPAADTPAVTVVKQFLADRAAGKYDAMYALLSADTRQTNSLQSFEQGDPTAAHDFRDWPAPAFGLLVLFLDTHNTLSYTFTVAGPDPADPSAVLVRATPPAPSTPVVVSPITLRLLTVADPAVHAPRLDFLGAVQRAAPERFTKERDNARQVVSLSNLKQLALGIIQYTQDHDEKMPDAAIWVDEIMPYVKAEELFHDPSAPAGEKWSYAYNLALSHKSLAQFDAPAQTVMLFESTKGVKNASDTGQSVPVPGRHKGGTDYALADGHAKWFPDGTKLSFKLSDKYFWPPRTETRCICVLGCITSWEAAYEDTA